jgi:phasin family protein
MTEAMRSLTGTESPQDRAQRQAELLKAGYERAVSNIREIGDLIQKSSAEALDLLNRRFAEAMEEVKQLAAKK